MRLVNYLREQEIRIGYTLESDSPPGSYIIDLEGAWKAFRQANKHASPAIRRLPRRILEALQASHETWDLMLEIHRFLNERRLEFVDKPDLALTTKQISLLPPIHRPGKIVCVGLNFPPPAAQAGSVKPKYPVLFHKVSTSLTGHMAPIVIPAVSQRVEYEGELAVIIGRRGKHIPREQAMDYIAGYTIANDVGAKDIEQRTSQWTSGKMLDSFCPLGPALVSRDEAPKPNTLRIRTRLNGELVQDGNTAEMIFDVPYLVSYISSLATLEPGDLILTGSPKCLGQLPDPRKPLKPGDMVSVEIERIGQLENPVVAEEA